MEGKNTLKFFVFVWSIIKVLPLPSLFLPQQIVDRPQASATKTMQERNGIETRHEGSLYFTNGLMITFTRQWRQSARPRHDR